MVNSAQVISFRRHVVPRLAAAGILVLVSWSPAWCQSRPAAAKGEKPVVTILVPSIDRVYRDVAFAFDLAGDPQGYKTLKETVDVFIEGVQTDKPAGMQMFVTADGMRPVASLPVRSESELGTFVQSLWDLDLKTAPPPKPVLMPQVPVAIRSKLQSLKLQPAERVIFGLHEGFLRHESGYVYLGKTLDSVRLARGELTGATAKGPIVSAHIDGESQAPAPRREAFEKGRERVLSRLKRTDHESEADFALKKAIVELQLARLELLFVESSQAEFALNISHKKKQAEISAAVSGAKGTSLAGDITRIGQSPDEFAGVSKQNAVLSGSINLPVNAALGKSLKAVTRQARGVAKERLGSASGKDANDLELANLLLDVAHELSEMPVFNGFVRMSKNGGEHLTTVVAAAVSDGEKYRERVRKFKTRENVSLKEAGHTGVEIHKIHVNKWPKDAPELFDKEGSVLIATSDRAIWYAFGERALERMEQALNETHGSAGSKSESAFELSAQMLPLAEVWNKIHSRRKAEKTAAKPIEKNKEKGQGKENKKGKESENGQSKTARTASVIAELDLPTIAVEAFRQGQDTMSLSLSRQGEKAILAARFDEGTLRFVGQALSRFVKDNLED